MVNIKRESKKKKKNPHLQTFRICTSRESNNFTLFFFFFFLNKWLIQLFQYYLAKYFPFFKCSKHFAP